MLVKTEEPSEEELNDCFGFVFVNKYYKIFVSYDKELLEMTVIAIRLYAISYLISWFNIFSSSLFTALNNGLIKFPGVILFTSHDHQFVQTTANRIMEILPNGSLIDKITTYDEYLASDEMARKRTVFTADKEEDQD